MADLFTVALGISLAAGFLTILIVIIVTRLSAEERVYEAPPPAQPESKPSPTPTPPSALEQPPAIKKVKEELSKPKKKPRKKGKLERYPDCFGTKYIYEKCKRDCGVVDECLKVIEILEPYS